MERRDIIALIAGIAVVIAIAVAIQAPVLFSKTRPVEPPSVQAPVILPDNSSLPVTGDQTLSLPTTIPTPARTPENPVPYRIYYTSKPLSYPVFTLPENMETFGASEIPWKDPDTVPFAYIEEPRGGLTQKFRVPYGVWGMNMTVTATTKPQYARFQMVLCHAKDGAVIDGMEILNRGSAFRSVQISDTDMYIIVHTRDVDRFRISFETPRVYYNQVAAR